MDNMNIGSTIRKYRKDNNLTQEEMARYLGVTAPAVNKWEKGNSLPDITLLAPIARLLNISLNTLLSFEKDLSDTEIDSMLQKLHNLLNHETFEHAYTWGKKQTETYPTCHKLLVQIAVVLDAHRLFHEIILPDGFEDYILSLYKRALESDEETIRLKAADALCGYYIRKKEYDMAEECLDFYSIQNPERKRKQAQIYMETHQEHKAYKCYEEMVLSDYERVSASLHGIYLLAVQSGDLEKAHKIAYKQSLLATVFEMGKYYEVSSQLELAVIEKNADKTLEIMKTMLENCSNIAAFRNSFLYEHINTNKAEPGYISQIKNNLIKEFSDEETFHYLVNHEEWKSLIFPIDSFQHPNLNNQECCHINRIEKDTNGI